MNFNYDIIDELPLEEIHSDQFKDHRRIRVYRQKGVKCVSCDFVGTKLLLGKQKKGGGKHWDVYDNEMNALTIDHIIPKSMGGSNHITNLQPMCKKCNELKGSGDVPKNPAIAVDKENYFIPNKEDSIVGKLIYKRVKAKRKFLLRELGTAEEVTENPNTSKLSARIGTSYYHVGTFYIKR